jgi:hypothetical protein
LLGAWHRPCLAQTNSNDQSAVAVYQQGSCQYCGELPNVGPNQQPTAAHPSHNFLSCPRR